MPMKPTAPTQASVLLGSSHCRASAGMMKEISPTSIASMAQPSPDTTRKVRCIGEKGSRSSRSMREGVLMPPPCTLPAHRALRTASASAFPGRSRRAT